jgi:hypothetical protein
LLLLVEGTRALVATISAFTVGHSVTLTLAVLGVTSVPQAPVEVLIAASVFVLAVELARPAGPDYLRRKPWTMAFVFGLLHGLGFAGMLSAAGLPSGAVPLALAFFNIGIELGQLAFVAVVVLGLRAMSAVAFAAPPWCRTAVVYAMGSLAAYWMIERAAPLL